MTAPRGTPENRAAVPSDPPAPLLPPQAELRPRTLPTPIKIARPAAHGPYGCIITVPTPPAAICPTHTAKVNHVTSRPVALALSADHGAPPRHLALLPMPALPPSGTAPPSPASYPPPSLPPPACHPHKPRRANFYQPRVSFCILGAVARPAASNTSLHLLLSLPFFYIYIRLFMSPLCTYSPPPL